jgi:hypothetical protein
MCILQHLDEKCWTPKMCAIAVYHDTNNFDYCENKSMINKEAVAFLKDIYDDGDVRILQYVDAQYITPQAADMALKYNVYNILYIPAEILSSDMLWYVVKEQTKAIGCIPADRLTDEMLWFAIKNKIYYVVEAIQSKLIPKTRLTQEMQNYITQHANQDAYNLHALTTTLE